MTAKRAKKLLMSIGYDRNTANSFLRAFRVLFKVKPETTHESLLEIAWNIKHVVYSGYGEGEWK